MSVDTIPQSIFNSVEKVLRYLVPGLLFVFFVKVSFSPEKLNGFSPNITQTEFYLLSPVLGFAIYVVHRVFFWLVDWFCRHKSGLTLTESLRGQADRKKELADVLYYRWALVHFSLILSELTIVFLFLADNGTIVSSYSTCLGIFAFIFLTICLWFYYQLSMADMELIGKRNGNC